MKKTVNYLFVAAVALICIIPLVGMVFTHSDTTTENRRLSAFPCVVSEGKLNIRFLPELGAYFEDHFALRQELTAANSAVLANVFQTSPVDTIIKGKGDWLFYKDSLSDYRHENVISKREAFCLSHNLALVKNRLERENIGFLFTVAPNKNSLYDENMPYYYRHRAQKSGNMQMLSPYLKSEEVPYADLFKAFSDYDGVLYRKQDSHWTGEGALLAYKTVMDATGLPYDAHDKAVRKPVRVEAGDLGRSLYGKYAKADWDVLEDIAVQYSITNDAEDWEALTVVTASSVGEGSLLMFRDSFGNTLSPLLADAFSKGTFSKATVYHLDQYIAEDKPDYVIFEIVERNLTNFIAYTDDSNESGPPVIKASKIKLKPEDESKGTALFDKKQLESEPKLGFVYGNVSGIKDPETRVFVGLTKDKKTSYYEAFLTSDLAGNDYGFLLYLPWETLKDKETEINIFVKTDGKIYITKTGEEK